MFNFAVATTAAPSQLGVAVVVTCIAHKLIEDSGLQSLQQIHLVLG